MFNEKMVVTGHPVIEVFDAQGNLKERRDLPNLVVSTGKAHMAARLVGTPVAMGWMALGTGTTAPTLADAALQSELSGSRIAVTGATSSGNVATFTTTYGAGVGTGAITEAGIFNSATTGGTMLARVTFSVVNKGASDVMNISWTITYN